MLCKFTVQKLLIHLLLLLYCNGSVSLWKVPTPHYFVDGSNKTYLILKKISLFWRITSNSWLKWDQCNNLKWCNCVLKETLEAQGLVSAYGYYLRLSSSLEYEQEIPTWTHLWQQETYDFVYTTEM